MVFRAVRMCWRFFFFFFQAEDGIRDKLVTGVKTCALPISGEVTRAFNTTKMVDRIAAKYGRRLNEHGIGFKYVVDLMLEKEILIGGEESGGIGISRHLPERDGLLNSLRLANVMADEK